MLRSEFLYQYFKIEDERMKTIETRIQVLNKVGLHARPAVQFVKEEKNLTQE